MPFLLYRGSMIGLFHQCFEKIIGCVNSGKHPFIDSLRENVFEFLKLAFEKGLVFLKVLLRQ